MDNAGATWPGRFAALGPRSRCWCVFGALKCRLARNRGVCCKRQELFCILVRRRACGTRLPITRRRQRVPRDVRNESRGLKRGPSVSQRRDHPGACGLKRDIVAAMDPPCGGHLLWDRRDFRILRVHFKHVSAGLGRALVGRIPAAREFRPGQARNQRAAERQQRQPERTGRAESLAGARKAENSVNTPVKNAAPCGERKR